MTVGRVSIPSTIPSLNESRLRARSLRHLLEAECLVIVAIAGVLGTLALALPKMVVSDTWLAFVDGRWIADHGLPRTDALAAWTLGTRWTDQQWLAHLA